MSEDAYKAARRSIINNALRQSRQLTAVPPEIGQLTALRSLSLSGNQLTALPPEIGRLTALRSLDLHVNRLTALPLACRCPIHVPLKVPHDT
jgi:Leucine-rich repeat (LRR) protein